MKSTIIRTDLPKTGFVRLPDVLAIIPISKSSWWDGIKAGRYPKGVKLSKRCTAWRVTDIHALIASYEAANDE